MLPFVHPFTAIVAGPTSCGKTRFAFRLIDNAPTAIYPPFAKIVYCYGEYQELFRQFREYSFARDFQTLETLTQRTDAVDYRRSHSGDQRDGRQHVHEGIAPQKRQRHLPRPKPVSATQVCANHKSQCPLHGSVQEPRDVEQFANFERQMYLKTSQFAVEAYRDATREPYSYLLVDLRPEQDEDLRLRTNIFPGETHYVYMPKQQENV